MFEDHQEIFIGIIGGTVLLLIFVIVLIVALVTYQYKKRKHLLELASYKKQIGKIDVELRENILSSVSREVHDNYSQIITLVKLNLNGLKFKDDVVNGSKIESSINLLTNLLDNLRNLSKILNTNYITDNPLSESIENLLNHVKGSGKFRTELIIEGHEVNFHSDVKTIIYRIIQEAVNNCIKHSKADFLKIELNYTSVNSSIRIIDNGQGIDEKLILETNKGIGINNMKARSEMINASFVLKSDEGKGAVVELIIPNK